MRRKEYYTRDDMAVFDLLEHPIYIFDILNKCLWWANAEAVKMWNATSLTELLERDFASDMSEASKRRMLDYLRKFKKGERVRESWTMYPNGVRTTTKETCSGITIGTPEEHHVAILCECDLVTLQEDIDHASLRGVEMLRHLPVAVSQFDVNGILMEQNPEALDLFGGLEDEEETDDCFTCRFVDRELGKRTLQQLQQGTDCISLEAQQHTTKGARWSAIKARKARDPVSQDPVILYSARDITELIQAKNDANRAFMEKSEMLAVLAHEIRTPLHQVIGFIELLVKNRLTSREKEDILHTLQSSTVSLMTIINDVLDFTKLEAGKMQLESIPFDPCAVCRGCLETIAAVAEQKKLQISGDCQEFPSLAIGDPNRIRQVLLNLLSNAVKFTHQGSVTLNMTRHTSISNRDEDGDDNCVLRFTVRDTGIGIPSESIQDVFNKFRQTSASVARQYGGTGLGLAICKILVQAMGGSITVTSQLDKGSVFSFDIPVQVCEPNQRRPIVEDGECSDSKVRLNVLVAEDNKVNQKLVKAMLKNIGHDVCIVENGREAVEELDQNLIEYDVVLMDVQMPIMDGCEATQLIRSKGWTKDALPIIGLTASFQKSQLPYYQEIGMNDCIGKPVRLKALSEVIIAQTIRDGREQQ